MDKVQSKVLLLTPVNNIFPTHEILARYDNLYALLVKMELNHQICVINLSSVKNNEQKRKDYDELTEYYRFKYFEPVKDGELEYGSDKPIFRVLVDYENKVVKSSTLIGNISLESYMHGINMKNSPKRIVKVKTVVPITKEEKEIYDTEGWETITLKDNEGFISFSKNETDPDNCYFGVIGEERVNLFKKRDPSRPIIKLFMNESDILASSPIHNCKSIKQIINDINVSRIEEAKKYNK